MTSGNADSDRYDRIGATLNRIDARLDRLAMRHQALLHTLRITAYRHAENEKRIAALSGLGAENATPPKEAPATPHAQPRHQPPG